MKTKNILINYTGRASGGASYAYEMTKGLIENGVNVYAIISKNVANISDWKKLDTKELIIIDTYTSKISFFINTILFFLYGRLLIKKRLKKVKLDAIYVPMGTYWTKLIDNIFKDINVYYTVHDPIAHSGESFFNRCYYHIYKMEIQSAYKVIVLSSRFVSVVTKIYKKDSKDIIVVPHGAFWEYREKYISSKKRTEENKKKAIGKVNFLFFGRIEKYKGIEILLKAYKKLEDNFHNKVTITIAGKGDLKPYAMEVEKINNLILLNYLIPDEEIGLLYSSERVVTVLPYLDATQSGVIPTAEMFKSLVIASDTGALNEQLDGGRYGLLFNVGNWEELYKIMEDVVLNYDAYSGFIKRGYEYISELTWDKLAKRIINQIT